ncbi:putative ATP-utilizing enzyme (ATP-grasp superfamily) [Beggiatoa alba B18LD]|uniref:Putative ATP-utilizing enzyme (ATP-grasp superfamily) n=1 Tax=Beggiatoa alba B18LD TaxID=395493 RepID=I3CI13_9GAMM|nr:ATP-grasp domain-containing protein [Beggiatoa alba]EIJ43256.1 putative ATP-utilizing enzyme (ATP-grasp superfamily) [Beggiatoa alba B18LD]
MRLFIFEFVSSGYLLNQPLPTSLTAEGELMLRCLLNDALEMQWHDKIEICTLRDHRLPALTYPIKVYTAHSTNEARAHWQTALLWADNVLVVAPETEDVLATFSQSVLEAKKGLLGCSPNAIRLTTSKRQTALLLAKHQLPTIPTYQPRQAFPDNSTGWIIKPDTGAGCEHTFFCQERANIRQYLPRVPNPIIQPYIQGDAASLTLLTDGISCRLAAVNKQGIQWDDKQKLYLSHVTVNALYPFASRFQPLLDCLCSAITGLWGWIGIDVIITETGYAIIEINPRLTTSYAGLGKSLQANPLFLLLQLSQTKDVLNTPLAHNPVLLGI